MQLHSLHPTPTSEVNVVERAVIITEHFRWRFANESNVFHVPHGDYIARVYVGDSFVWVICVGQSHLI